MMSSNPYSVLAETVPSSIFAGFCYYYAGFNSYRDSYTNDSS